MTLRSYVRRVYRALPFKLQLFEKIRSRVRLPHKIYQHLHFEGPFSVQIDSRHRYQIYSHGSQVENDLFWAGHGGGWERTSLRVWTALCEGSNRLILDIGANTGVYALSAAAVAPQATIIAFEPIARIAAMLSRNVALNGFSIAIEQSAVSDHSGRLPIYDTLVEHNYSASLEGQGPNAASYEVDVVSIDDWLAKHPDELVTALKIDVERHEPAAIRGMRTLLATQRPSVLIEILDEVVGAQVASSIEGFGYTMYQIDERRGLIPVERMTRLRQNDRNHLLCTPENFERARLSRFLGG
jgi:FkbM family methyltransferase